MFKAKIFVNLKESVLDPKGKAVELTLHNLGYKTINDVRISKYIELTVNEVNEQNATKSVNDICDKVLANPNVESYKFTIESIHE